MLDNITIPIFYDTSSRKSILTYDLPNEVKNNGPQSIIKLCKENNINKVVGVSNNFHNYLTAYKNCKKSGLQLIFGIEFWICDDPTAKEDAAKNESKIIVFIKNEDGYRDLIKLYSAIYTNINNKYYKFRGSWKLINDMWSDNLILALPWADSFIYQNTLTFSQIIPNFPVAPYIFREQNSGLPFERLINLALDKFNNNDEYKEIKTKTIYYPTSDDLDVKSFIVYRSIMERSSFSKPELNYMSSRNFSFQNFLELVKKK